MLLLQATTFHPSLFMHNITDTHIFSVYTFLLVDSSLLIGCFKENHTNRVCAMLRSIVCCAPHLKPRIKGGIIPFHQRIRQEIRWMIWMCQVFVRQEIPTNTQRKPYKSWEMWITKIIMVGTTSGHPPKRCRHRCTIPSQQKNMCFIDWYWFELTFWDLPKHYWTHQ